MRKLVDSYVLCLDSLFEFYSNETLLRLSRSEILLPHLEEALNLQNTETLAGSCCCDCSEYSDYRDYS